MFTSERGTPFTKRGFQAMVKRAGEAAGFDMKIHPHILRHACGFKLANDGSILGPSRPISATSRSSIRFVTPTWHRLGSKVYSRTDCAMKIRKGDPSFSSFKIVKYLSH